MKHNYIFVNGATVLEAKVFNQEGILYCELGKKIPKKYSFDILVKLKDKKQVNIISKGLIVGEGVVFEVDTDIKKIIKG